MSRRERQSTGIAELDALLGGGLLPGTLTVVLGATGIGKTQLGLQYLAAGREQEGERGILFDMTARGDSQNHAEYAARLCDWSLHQHDVGFYREDIGRLWEADAARRDLLHLFQETGRRVTASNLDFDEQRAWKAELNRKLETTIEFFYANFVHGVRRCVIDGIEPTDRPSDSFQFDLFEYIYHQILRKDASWVARDLLRARYREQAEQVAAHDYSVAEIGCLMLVTTHEVMLEDLLSRRLESGDVLSNANTIIVMGKIREGTRMGRALHVAKHRGSACSDEIIPYRITDCGMVLESE